MQRVVEFRSARWEFSPEQDFERRIVSRGRPSFREFVDDVPGFRKFGTARMIGVSHCTVL